MKNKSVNRISTDIKHSTDKWVGPKPSLPKNVAVTKKPVTGSAKPAHKPASTQVKTKPIVPKSVMPKRTVQKPINEY